jgi:hypothetical protein
MSGTHQGGAMKLSETHYDNTKTGCCAPLDAARWEGATVEWTNKPFVKDHIHAFMHVPLDFGSVMAREHALVERAEAYPEDPLWLVDELSPWGSDVLLATDREVPGAEMVHLSGTFMTKVFEGGFRQIGTWVEAMEKDVASKGRKIDKLYFFYATCPSCAKKLGKNEVALFAKVV